MAQDTRHRLPGRQRELEQLEDLLRALRTGQGRALVLIGEAGIGKTALLGHLAGAAREMQVVRTGGVEAEASFDYSALQRLCDPLLAHLDRLAAEERHALSVTFGLSGGAIPEPQLVESALVGLLSAAAVEAPLVCLVDDAQWLDPPSRELLAAAGQRLEAVSVGLVLAVEAADETLAEWPQLMVGGLPDADARALLDATLSAPIDPRARDRIVAEARGNPF
ncbi:MAG: ATP-binding protein, partial [Catenulispora sp.]|nr:ATP-binding protein [Catenulispora sp.]